MLKMPLKPPLKTTNKKMILIKVNDKVVHKTQNKKEAFSILNKVFARGLTDVYMCGGKIGSWK